METIKSHYSESSSIVKSLQNCIIVPSILYFDAIKINNHEVTSIDHMAVDAIHLYSLYFFHTIWQSSTEVYVTNKYCMRFLKWGKKRLLEAKNYLKMIDLIAKVEKKHPDRGFCEYIKLKGVVFLNTPGSLEDINNISIRGEEDIYSKEDCKYLEVE